MSNIAFIAARMGSERLPGKVIKELRGIPSLVHIFNILKECKNLDDFAVVSTVLAEDDVLENICRKNSVKIIRGSVHDVLDRFRLAAGILKPERIIRVTGDDPLMDPEIIDHVIEEHCSGNFDYSSNIAERTYPRGMDELFRICSVRKDGEAMDDLRLCLDTEQDYNLIKEIYDNLYQSRPIRLTEVIEFLKVNPEMKKINSGITQKAVKGKIF